VKKQRRISNKHEKEMKRLTGAGHLEDCAFLEVKLQTGRIKLQGGEGQGRPLRRPLARVIGSGLGGPKGKS